MRLWLVGLALQLGFTLADFLLIQVIKFVGEHQPLVGFVEIEIWYVVG